MQMSEESSCRVELLQLSPTEPWAVMAGVHIVNWR